MPQQLKLTRFSLEDVELLVQAGGYFKPMHKCTLVELMETTNEQQKFEDLFVKEFGGGDGIKNDGEWAGEE